MAERVGQQLGNYRVLRELGRGGFADAYLGEHIYLKSHAALKILHTSLAESDVARFLSEAQTLVRLRHPHIVRVLEFVIEGGTPVLIMDYAPGGTARQLHPRGSRVPLATVVAHIRQIATALHYAHSRNVIHRDVKPENLLLDEQQALLLSDFGLALLTPTAEELSTQEMAGTIPYMAPEQIRGKPGFASDQYALGIIAYEWLCGTRPFEGTAFQILQQHLEVAPPPLREKNADVPEPVEEVVLRALAKDPQQRFVSIQAFSHALERTYRGSGAGSQSEITTTLRRDSSSSSALLPSHRTPADSYLPYGVFLAAASADDAFATRLRSDLEGRGRGVFVWNGRLAGTKYAADQEEELRQEIRAARLVVVILTPRTRSSRTVKKHLLIASMYERELLLIWQDGDAWAELLPNGWESTNVLDLIDARGTRYELALDEIVSYLEDERGTSIALEATLTKPRAEMHEPRNPYKGLYAFTGADAGDFFGRGRLVESFIDEVAGMVSTEQTTSNERRLLTVIGPSGSGKSSVVMAGLLPRLQRGALPGSQSWVILEAMTPDKHPIEELGLVLAKRFPGRSFLSIREDLEDESTRGLHVLASQLVKEPGTRVVLLVDQFEELFTQTEFEDERAQFIELLLTATTEPRGPLLVVLTLRADFSDRPMYYPELHRLMHSHLRQIPPMEVGDLRETIEQPAALADVQLTFEGNLVGDLLYEMQRQPGALPLLQFTLEQLFERRDAHRFTLQAYREIGGVRGAISRHAERTYSGLPSEEHRRLARILFLRLIDPGIVEQDTTRRRAALSEFSLTDASQTRLLGETIEAFVAARLLMTNVVGGTTTIEVSHEVLIREWPRLIEWVREAREDIPLQQAISKDVAEWEGHGKPRDRSYRGSQLKEAKAWAERNMPSSSEMTFLQAGTRQQMRFRLRIAGVTVLILLLLIPTGWLVWQHFQPSVTTLKDDGPGSLRQAIVAAKPGDTITFDSRLKGTIVLTKEDLTISKSLTILGPGADTLSISSGNNNLRVHVLRGFSVVITGLTFKNSKSSFVILNEGKLTLTNCLVFGNTSTQASGGGISNFRGTLTLINSTVSDNAASGSYGGGISNYQGTLILTNSTVSDNTASGGLGGGISNYQGTLTITNSTVSGNIATHGSGGGVSNYQGTLTITNSTVSGNTATRGGGIDNTGSLTLTNSTVSDNIVSGGNGGGIANTGGTITLTNSTIASNTSDGGNGGGITNSSFGAVNGMLTLINSTISSNRTLYFNGYGGNGGGIFNEGSRAAVIFSTVYNNTATYSGGGITIGTDSHQTASRVVITDSILAANSAPGGPDISGVLNAQGYNLIQNISGATIQIDGPVRNIIGSSPKLGTLQKNGGPTRTHALQSGSPAIDQIPLRVCHLTDISTDQRGMKRPDDNEQFCDIGAYEYQGL